MLSGYIGDGLFHCVFLIRGGFSAESISLTDPLHALAASINLNVNESNECLTCHHGRPSITLLYIDTGFFLRHAGCVQWNKKIWQRSLDEFPEFLEPLVAQLGRSERREGAALYVQGLLMPGERKSIEPMAERLGIDSQKLQQFIADSPWDEQEVWRASRREVVPVMEPLVAWIIDEAQKP